MSHNSSPHASRGMIYANTATLLFGLAGVLGKLSGLPATVITLGRVLFAAAALGVWITATHSPLRPKSRRDLATLVFVGLLLALHWSAFFQAIVVSNVAVGLLSFSSFPLFTAMLEPLILRQRPRTSEIIAACAILPGVFLLVPQFSLASNVTRGVLWGILAGATFAALSVLNRGLTARYASATISLYQDGVAALALLPTLLVVSLPHGISGASLVILAALGIGCTALAHTLFIASLRNLTTQLASLIAALEPVWGVAFAWLLLNEAPTLRTLLGGVFIVGATMLPGAVSLVGRRFA